MINQIVIVTGLLAFTDSLFNKLNAYDSICTVLERIGEKLNTRIIFRLAQCQFCQRFWISVKITSLLGLFSEVGFKSELIVIPFIATGIFNLLKNETLV